MSAYKVETGEGGYTPLAPNGAQARCARTPHPSGARAQFLRNIALPVTHRFLLMNRPSHTSQPPHTPGSLTRVE
ncbi:hypothetical protein MchiMG62_07580 [Methanoculleus chikugoensis]|uniref:Uncharacterized protein n=1 Tax=Methanoculleus chikugoensis TaxID=118126 RepID=A0ABM7H473_9EURY|nr:hypothetical protein MchiMG62_07580 [Methanoculleus chikugoensis]